MQWFIHIHYGSIPSAIPETKNHIHNESITKVVKSKVVKSLRKFVPLKNQKEKRKMKRSQKNMPNGSKKKKKKLNKILSISFEIYCQNA